MICKRIFKLSQVLRSLNLDDEAEQVEELDFNREEVEEFAPEGGLTDYYDYPDKAFEPKGKGSFRFVYSLPGLEGYVSEDGQKSRRG